jgi:hypothetical protein
MSLIALDALGTNGEYRTRKTELVSDTRGNPVAALSVVPRLFVSRSIAAQRRMRPLSLAEREAALQRAAELFRTSSISGLDFDGYVELTCRVTGLPMTVARAGAHVVAESVETTFNGVRPARPVGAELDWRTVGRGGGAVWARRGEVLAVHAPGNAPRRARAVAAGARTGLPGRDPPVQAGTVHGAPPRDLSARGRIPQWGRAVPAH